jgi:lipid-binding SYLF domain-containing protein
MIRRSFVLLIVLTLCLGSAGWATRKVEDYSETINNFKKSSDVAPLFDHAYGYAVFPNIGRGGLGVGGAHGKGQVYKGGEVTGFTSLSDVTIGLQAGGQAYSQIIFFETESAYNKFTGGNFEFEAAATAIAIQSGASASAGTAGGASAGASSGGSGGSYAGKFDSGMLVLTMAKGGLMYQATIGGQKYSFNPVE